jgi:hypothetical protein
MIASQPRPASPANARLRLDRPCACSGVKALRNTSSAMAARRQAARAFRSLDPCARSGNLTAGDGTKNGLSRSEQRTGRKPTCNKRRIVRLSQLANVTVTIAARGEDMPKPRIGAAVMTPAQRQARRRARLRRENHTPPTPPARRTPPRPKRWAAAVAALIDLRDDYRAWLDNLPASLEGSRLAEKLQAIAELDLEELQAIDPPRGYGRD